MLRLGPFHLLNLFQRPMRLTLLCLSSIFLTPLLAQGSDDCLLALAITGPGPHAFDNSVATLDGAADPLCLAFGSDQVEQDVWFRWTAAVTAPTQLSFCGQTTVDTKVAVYDGVTCNDIMLACNDDSCGFQSALTFAAVAGSEYLVRVGTYPGAPGGIGTFDFTPQVPVVNPGNGHSYLVVNEGPDWFTARAAAEAMSFNGLTGHLVTIVDQAEHDWIQANLVFNRPWIGLYQNTTSSTYAEPAGGWEWITGEPFTFTFWAAGEPNDNPVGEDFAEWHGGGWNDMVGSSTTPTEYIVEFDGLVGGPGLFCDPANNASSGQPVTLENSDLSGPGLFHLEAEGGPVDQFGFFLISASESPSPIAVSQGLLCLAAPIGRYSSNAGPALNSLGRFDSAGVLQNLAGTSSVGSGFDISSALPDPPAGVIASGDTWLFQLWFRDLGGASNFSNGIAVTF